jgi:hypothetical protein
MLNLDFNTNQLTWLLIGLGSMGGTGYLNVCGNIQELSTKVAVQSSAMENTNKSLDQLRIQLDRIENKIDNKKNHDK